MRAGSYRFGPFEVDRAAFRLVRNGAETVMLTPKLLDLLLHLLDHAGELVTKEALLDAVWPGANVTDNAVAQAVSELRQALDDHSGSPRFIKTVARRGYRFVAAVEAVGAPTPPPVPTAAAVRIGARETSSLDAYRAATEGWLRIESLEVGELQHAVDDFRRAVSLDHRYALAYTGLANAEFALYEATRSDNEPAQERLEQAVDHARHGIVLDDGLAEAHATLALLLVSAWRTEEAVSEARRAVAIEPANWRHHFRLGHASWGDARLKAGEVTLAQYPTFAFAHFQMAMVHVARGRLQEAEAILRRGAAVQERQREHRERFPALGLYWLFGLVSVARHDTAGALAAFDRELRLADPERLYGREYAMSAHYGRGLTLLLDARADEAVAEFQRAIELYPDYPQAHLALAAAYRRLGAADGERTATARADAALVVIARTKPIEAAIVGAMRRATDEPDQAIALLERMLEDAPPGFAGWAIPIEPLLGELQKREAFKAVLKRLADRAR